MEKDIIVIGGGPGGYVAAIHASQLGARVTVVEKERLGGTCLNKGCIPTKVLYKNAEIINQLKSINEFGISIDAYMVNMPDMIKRKQNIVTRLTDGVGQLLKANSVEVVYGTAKLVEKGIVEVTGSNGEIFKLQGKNILISTGSRPAIPPIPGAELPGIMSSDDILEGESIPKSLTIIGGGVIGIEYAGIFSALGAEVTVIEFLPRILANLDGEISKRIPLFLKKKGITFETETRVKEIKEADHGFDILAEGKKGEKQIHSEAVLISTGRRPNIDGLNLDTLGVAYDKKGIKVDEHFSTNVPGIYAIGDAVGGYMLAHVASEEGKVAVENILGLESHMNYSAVPSCVFSFPEIATVGLAEEEAQIKGISYNSGKFMFGANGKAMAMGEEEGFIKVLNEKETGIIIGVHIIGPHASDLIQEGVLAVQNKMTVEEISKTIHAHPTLSEAFVEAALAAENKAIHVMPRKRE